MTYSRRDDGGVSVSGAPEKTSGWQSNKFLRGEPGALEPGVTYFLEQFAEGEGIGCRAIWQKSDGSYVTVASGKALVLDEDYVEVHFQAYVPTEYVGRQVDAVVFPMLPRSDAPGGYFAPSEVGGGGVLTP